MLKNFTTFIVVFIACFYCPFFICAQSEEQRWEKTITLPSGEVILDMRGEWDAVYEHYGMFSGLGSNSDVLTITQEGKIFIAVKQIGSYWVPKGSLTIKGECCNEGFKVVEGLRADVGWVPCTWEISEAGNKIVIDDERAVRVTLIRK